ncbi:hypothetical protein BDN72DRAFT_654618 [Pluteus cervinus]|uniref:Uncharacterized protein n=1 Tax=Pluteus cervinus TaxID=181527 RepID=A0ACD3AT29_9AGAR|nr:hypothetical protein BDN72DRAFT_654618 [Pluteus cervinus]
MILNLSPELVLAIFAYLDVPSIAICKKVSVAFFDLISNDVEIQYRFLLHSENLGDGPAGHGTASAHNGSSIKAKLEQLKLFSHRRTFTDLRRYPRTEIRYTTPTSSSSTDPYPITFTCTQLTIPPSDSRIQLDPTGRPANESDFAWQCHYHSLGTGTSTWLLETGIRVLQLPGSIRGVPLRLWDIDLAEQFRLEDNPRWDWVVKIWLDPSQDLLIVSEKLDIVQMKLHFRSLSTGHVHPLARVPYVQTEFTSLPGDQNINIGGNFSWHAVIQDECFAISHHFGTRRRVSQLLIINWKTGEIEK